ncbi:MAG: formylglycine-generating enzyme family protein [Chloroflexi bacterium]|nr:formylglycine-generating enzyme family protein [Chloroflexota bacterium]
MNSGEGGVGDTTPVGQYSPGGDSLYSATDMAGNVWEWCSTIWEEKAYPFKVQDEWSKAYLDRTNVHRVLRGGAFVGGAADVRCAARGWGYPSYRRFDIGFRVVLPPK